MAITPVIFDHLSNVFYIKIVELAQERRLLIRDHVDATSGMVFMMKSGNFGLCLAMDNDDASIRTINFSTLAAQAQTNKRNEDEVTLLQYHYDMINTAVTVFEEILEREYIGNSDVVAEWPTSNITGENLLALLLMFARN